MKTKIAAVVPEINEDEAYGLLVELTKTIEKAGSEVVHGFLGGTYGYGADYENDVFMMHPYCWCEQESCPWCTPCGCVPDCEQYVDGKRVKSWWDATKGMVPAMPSDVAEYGTPEYKKASKAFDKAIAERNKRIKIIYPEVKHHCNYKWALNLPRREESRIPEVAPNFWHKASGLRIWWYKYVGRGMEFYLPPGVECGLAIKEAINSIKAKQ